MATKRTTPQGSSAPVNTAVRRPADPATSERAEEAGALAAAPELEPVAEPSPEPAPVPVIESVAGIPVRRAAVVVPAAEPCAHAWERGRQDGVQTYRCALCGAHKPR